MHHFNRRQYCKSYRQLYQLEQKAAATGLLASPLEQIGNSQRLAVKEEAVKVGKKKHAMKISYRCTYLCIDLFAELAVPVEHPKKLGTHTCTCMHPKQCSLSGTRKVFLEQKKNQFCFIVKFNDRRQYHECCRTWVCVMLRFAKALYRSIVLSFTLPAAPLSMK